MSAIVRRKMAQSVAAADVRTFLRAVDGKLLADWSRFPGWQWRCDQPECLRHDDMERIVWHETATHQAAIAAAVAHVRAHKESRSEPLKRVGTYPGTRHAQKSLRFETQTVETACFACREGAR